MTDRYNQPVEGAQDWHVPLNENWSDLGVEVAAEVQAWSDLPAAGETEQSSNGQWPVYRVQEDSVFVRVSDSGQAIVGGLGSEAHPVPEVHSQKVSTDVSRTKSEPVANVKAYGAAGDGQTNDTQAIQDALDAGAGGTVYIPAGDYLHDEVNPRSNTRIIGDGYATQLLYTGAAGTAGAHPIKGENVSNVEIAHLRIDGQLHDFPYSNICFIDSTECHVHHVWSTGAARPSGSFDAGDDYGSGIEFRNGVWNSANHNWTYENEYDGIKVRSDNSSAIGNKSWSNGKSGIQFCYRPADDSQIVNCAILGNIIRLPDSMGPDSPALPGITLHGCSRSVIGLNRIAGESGTTSLNSFGIDLEPSTSDGVDWNNIGRNSIRNVNVGMKVEGIGNGISDNWINVNASAGIRVKDDSTVNGEFTDIYDNRINLPDVGIEINNNPNSTDGLVVRDNRILQADTDIGGSASDGTNVTVRDNY